MSEQLKIEQLKAKIELVKCLNTGGSFVSPSWAMKNIFGFDSKNEIRKFKIDRIYG